MADITFQICYGSPKYSRNLKGKSLIDFPTSYVVIDIETTGLSPTWDSIIELAAIKVVDSKVIDEYQRLINPGFQINHFIENLTGITNEMLNDAPPIEDVFTEYINFIGDNSIILGHNVNFDINFLYEKRMQLEDKPISNDFVDTMKLSRHLLSELQHHRLCDLIEYYNIQTNTQHRALADCYSTSYALNHLKDTALKKFGTIEKFVESTNKTGKYKNHYANVDLRTLTSSVNDFDESHPLYGKHCCFTGMLEKYTRIQAAQIVVDLGGLCDNNVTKNTNFLILGNNNYCSTIKDRKSSKQKKAEELILKGADLMILPEMEFYEMIEQESN